MCEWINNECTCPPIQEKCDNRNAFDCHKQKCDLDGDGVNDTRCNFDFSDGKCKCGIEKEEPRTCSDFTTEDLCSSHKCDDNITPCLWLETSTGAATCMCASIKLIFFCKNDGIFAQHEKDCSTCDQDQEACIANFHGFDPKYHSLHI
jgi:hypothetical protein